MFLPFWLMGFPQYFEDRYYDLEAVGLVAGARQPVVVVGAQQVVVAVEYVEVDKSDCIRCNPGKNFDHLLKRT